MGTNIENLYADHIESGKRTIDSVPLSIRENVRKILEYRKLLKEKELVE